MTTKTNSLLRSRQFVALLLAALLLLAGCGTTRSTRKQMERVAKDWAMVVRASQVIPVYPLNEDLQPGDLFLVQTPIEEQATLYDQKGFLPLDQLLARLQPNEYVSFYMKSYGIENNVNTPHHWQFPQNDNVSLWDRAPRAAFPSYSFSVKKGSGLNLALPVQGVPIALSFLGSGTAHGDITIADAYTYGVDIYSLNSQVEDWAIQHRSFLNNFASDNAADLRFLRIVTRVYLTGRVNISVFADESYGGAVSVADQRPPSVLSSIGLDNSTGLYDNVIAMLDNNLGKIASVPAGGSIKLAAASARSVYLIETFKRPLVIGYIGFDRAILKGGQLGPPIPTLSQLTRVSISTSQRQRFFTDDQEMLRNLIDEVMKRENRDSLLQHAVAILADPIFEREFDKNRMAVPPLPSRVAFLSAKNKYLGDKTEGKEMDRLIQALRDALK